MDSSGQYQRSVRPDRVRFITAPNGFNPSEKTREPGNEDGTGYFIGICCFQNQGQKKYLLLRLRLRK